MIRYAVVGAGWISQEAFLPAVPATGNSRVTALVSGSAEKAAKLAAFHDIPEVVDYTGYDALIASDRVDAVYVALPNDQHADFAIRALKAGKHVMVEKPLASTLAESEAMVAAAKASGRFLMTAYRLHCEPGTHALIDALRQGRIGAPVFFTSTFSFQSNAGNHRLAAGHWGGPLQDIGVYCLNAARHVFGAEPLGVTATEVSPDNDPRFAEVGATLAVTLRFPGNRLAQFFVSFAAAPSDMLRVIGTEGEAVLEPAYRFETVPVLRMRQGEGAWQRHEAPQVDHFAGQIAYFSDCIASGTPPEPDGEEGLADMRVLLAIEEAARTGAEVQLPPRAFGPGLNAGMVRLLPRTDRRLLL